MENRDLLLNAKIPGYADIFEKVRARCVEQKGLISASNVEVFKWLIDKELKNELSRDV